MWHFAPMSYRISDKYPERRSQRLRTSDRNIFSVRCEVLQRWRVPRDDNIDCCHRGNSIAIDLSLAHDERRDELVSSHSGLGVLIYGGRDKLVPPPMLIVASVIDIRDLKDLVSPADAPSLVGESGRRFRRTVGLFTVRQPP